MSTGARLRRAAAASPTRAGRRAEPCGDGSASLTASEATSPPGGTHELARQASIMVWFPMTLPTAICCRICETSRERSPSTSCATLPKGACAKAATRVMNLS